MQCYILLRSRSKCDKPQVQAVMSDSDDLIACYLDSSMKRQCCTPTSSLERAKRQRPHDLSMHLINQLDRLTDSIIPRLDLPGHILVFFLSSNEGYSQI